MFPENLVQACFQQVIIMTFASRLLPSSLYPFRFLCPAMTRELEWAHPKWQEMYLWICAPRRHRWPLCFGPLVLRAPEKSLLELTQAPFPCFWRTLWYLQRSLSDCLHCSTRQKQPRLLPPSSLTSGEQYLTHMGASCSWCWSCP